MKITRNTSPSPLDEYPKIPTLHVEKSNLLLWGSYPEEGIKKTPFDEGGKSSRFFMWALGEAEIYFPSISKGYLLQNKAPKKQINFYSDTVFDIASSPARSEIRTMIKKGTKTILVLGEEAWKFFGGGTGKGQGALSNARGSVYLFDTLQWDFVERNTNSNVVTLIPTYSASYLYQGMHAGGRKGKADLIAVWIDDLKKAKKISKEGWQPPKEDFNLYPDLAQVWDFVSKALRKKPLIAVDIETTGVDPKTAEIVCIGLANDANHALVVPFIDGPVNEYWSPGDAKQVVILLSKLFTECPLMFQNALFDVPFLRKKGFSIPHGAVKHDTMLLHHAISPELPHKLGFIVSQYGETPYWKDDFQERGTKITNMDQEVLRRYNARDCVVLHQVLPEMLEDLKEINAERVYYEESIPLIEVILSMHSCGVLYSPTKAKALKKKISEELAEKEKLLRTIANLPKAFNLGSDDDLRKLLFNEDSIKYDKGEAWQEARQGTKKREALKDLYDIRHATVPLYVPRGWRGRKTESGSTSVNKQGRLSYTRHLHKRLKELKSFKKLHVKHEEELKQITTCLEWLSIFQDYTELRKIFSTYMDYATDDDSRVRSQVLIHGTATGRLAYRSPNLQNLPKKKSKEIRELFIAPEGHGILAADYSNLEVKVMAYETGDPELIDIVDNGKNMHDINTKILFKLTPEDEMWGPARRASKIFMFGSLAYGGGDTEIYEKVILDVPELQLTFKEFVEAKQRYMESHPVYVQWRNEIIAKVKETRQVQNAFGRVRTFYGDSRNILKEAMNFPIQSAAASIINRAMIRINNRLKTEGYKSKLQAQIHDELRFEFPLEELHDLRKLVIEEMSQPVMFKGTLRTFDVTTEHGPDWGNLS